MNRSVFIILSMAIVLFSGCTQKVSIKALHPAEVERVAQTKLIAVTPFEHDDIGLAQKIQTAIAHKQLEGKPYFTVVDRSGLSKIVAEQRLQSSGLLNESTAVQIGKLLGAQALISGIVSSQTMQDSHYKVTRKKCKDDKCSEKYEIDVPCISRRIGMGASMKIVDVQAGEVIYSDSMAQHSEYNKCQDESRALPSKREGLESLASNIADSFAFKLAPHYVYFDVALMDEIEFEATDTQEQDLEYALEFIKLNRFDKARELLETLSDSFKGQSYAVLYDLGVIAEAQGRLDEAKKLYLLAENRSRAPQESIGKAIYRINETISKRHAALAQMNR